MKKIFFSILIFSLTSCGIEIAGQKYSLEGSPYWKRNASHNELTSYYSRFDIDEICSEWISLGYGKRVTRIRVRNALKDVLVDKGHDKYACMNLIKSTRN